MNKTLLSLFIASLLLTSTVAYAGQHHYTPPVCEEPPIVIPPVEPPVIVPDEPPVSPPDNETPPEVVIPPSDNPTQPEPPSEPAEHGNTSTSSGGYQPNFNQPSGSMPSDCVPISELTVDTGIKGDGKVFLSWLGSTDTKFIFYGTSLSNLAFFGTTQSNALEIGGLKPTNYLFFVSNFCTSLFIDPLP